MGRTSSERGKIDMRTFSLLFIAAFVASASAQEVPCVDQPIYDGDCPVFTDEDCTEEGKRYRVACNCHAYMWCLDRGEDTLNACFYKCNPTSLIFDPQTELCVKQDQAPPGTCFDTPSTIMPPTDQTTTTPKPTTTTETTTTPTTTSSTTTTTTTTTTTPPPPECEYVGQTFEYPGSCRKYFFCKPDLTSVIFD